MTESRFPMVFEKCPDCGSTETITRVAWDEEAEKGNVLKETKVANEQTNMNLVDPRLPASLEKGVLLLTSDYCVCGRKRLMRAEIVQMRKRPDILTPGHLNNLMPKGQG